MSGDCGVSFIIVRKAVLMEDEGREEFVKVYETREAAEKWIKDQKEEYFKPLDYYIAETTGDHR